jgi:hypothetical protein
LSVLASTMAGEAIFEDVTGMTGEGATGTKRPNRAMELTASRCTIQLSMSSTLQSAATGAPARGSSSCSR